MPSDQCMRTPPWLFKSLENYFMQNGLPPFKLDAAASPENALCEDFYTEVDNGLDKTWKPSTFCNPPFKNFGDWIRKAATEAFWGNVHSCPIGPVGCSQTRFHDTATIGTILAPNKRISFCDSVTGEQTRGADRDTMIYCIGPYFENQSRVEFKVKPLVVRW